MSDALTLIGLKNCDGCRKAMKWCRDNDVPFALEEIRDPDVLARVLERLATHPAWESFVNKRSTTWRQIPPASRAALTLESALELMASHPTLIKRPVVISADRTLAGFSPDAVRELL